MSPEKAGLEVVRPRNDSGGVFRRIRVHVDDVEVAGLLPGEAVTLDLGVGRHVVEARMDWARSRPFEVEVTEGRATRVQVSLPFSSILAVFTKPRSSIQVEALL